MIYGITAEYNPFHNGHLHHLKNTKSNEGDIVIVVMSGNFVQRGEIAICDMQLRAETAVECGADLVIQLPTLWAACSAERFSLGALDIMQALGVETVSFGAEIADVTLLRAAAEYITTKHCQELVKKNMADGMNYPAAIAKAAGKHAEALASPNNLLGIEYIKAANTLGFNCEFTAITREGAGHDSTATTHGLASAGQIRRLMLEGKPVSSYLPEAMYKRLSAALEAHAAPASIKALELAILARLRTMTPAELEALPDITEGLHNRIAQAAQKAVTLEQLFELAKTKRYTMARLRRVVLYSLLGLKASDMIKGVPYIRPLAFSPAGQEYLRKMKEQGCRLPIFMKSSAILEDPTCKPVFEKECMVSLVYSLCLPDPSKGIHELTRSPRRMV